MTSIESALRDAVAALSAAGIDNARLEARLLAAHVLDLSSAQVFARADRNMEKDRRATFDAAVARRCMGEPLAHITGSREFWSLEFHVSAATLIPRPDTEAVVDLAVDLHKARPHPRTVLDLGTGSGCILLALLTCFPEATGTGIEMSADACAVARENVRTLGLEKRADIVHASWADRMASGFDLIVSNPPYIPSADIAGLARDVRDHEPLSALDGGADGLAAYRTLLPLCAAALKDTGIIVVEVGIGQGADVAHVAAAAGLFAGPSRRDLGGIERALSFYKKGVGIAGGTG